MLNLLQALGGLGLFLLGMSVMTEGLRALAGDSMRAALVRFTHSPASGALTGALSTAILQSSSATIVAAVGFVGVGLLSFPQSLGIIFGANIGTTITGWLVALIGFKLQLGIVVLPLIFLAMLLKLFARGPVAALGAALAGFSLIFIGIDSMQQGMAAWQQADLFSRFPADDLWGRFQLLMIGVLFTVIAQSSSAGVAAALTALFAGLISFEQAAAMVIGMDIGTTVTAALATIGASREARRTGYSHVIYNLLTGAGAFFLLTPYIALWNLLSVEGLQQHAEIALVLFHSLFNLLGVLLVLPFTRQFARLIILLVPYQQGQASERLRDELLEQPQQALNLVHQLLVEQYKAVLLQLSDLLSGKVQDASYALANIRQTLDAIQSFVDKIHLHSEQAGDYQRLLAFMHTLDHMQRLLHRCEQQQRLGSIRKDSHLHAFANELLGIIQGLQFTGVEKTLSPAITQLQTLNENLLREEKPYRLMIMEKVAQGELDVSEGTRRFEAVRWLSRVAMHVFSMTDHLQEAVSQVGA